LSYLLDANVISELRKGQRADANVTAWFADVAEEEIFLSVLTIGEIRRGIEACVAAIRTQRPPWTAGSLS
jgi:toxin FitB